MLLRGAGLSEGAISPEVSAQLGQVLRVVVEGLMEVLRARGEIKNEFRLQQTTYKPRENNPLKFSPDVDAALSHLLGPAERGFLEPQAAVAEAFLSQCLGGRFQPVGDDFKGSSIQVPKGAEYVPGLKAALTK